MAGYFFIIVSSHDNLVLCRRHLEAGFPTSINGMWAFEEIEVGDYLSFLYGGVVYDLYRVEGKQAFFNASNIPPSWKPTRFELQGNPDAEASYPYRLHLRLELEFEQSLARDEFEFVGRNILARGGLRRSHFQATTETLAKVRSAPWTRVRPVEPRSPLQFSSFRAFTPKLIRGRGRANLPEIAAIEERFIQTLLRRHLLVSENLRLLINCVGDGTAEFSRIGWEVVGETALEEGISDLLLVGRDPVTMEEKKIVIEVKNRTAGPADVEQLASYMRALNQARGHCIGAALIAPEFSPRCQRPSRVPAFLEFPPVEPGSPQSMAELERTLSLACIDGT